MAFAKGEFSGITFFFTLTTALGIQISTNFVNDYCDFLKGADTNGRKGPLRVTQAGLVSLQTMKKAIVLSMLLTVAAGLCLVFPGGPLIAFLLVLALALAVLYTAGPYPLAYLGLGDLFVFCFFGPVAVLGTYFLQTKTLSFEPLFAGIGTGALSTAILTVNNLRDVEEDAAAHKKTVAVRFGNTFAKIEYVVCLLIAAATPLFFIKTRPLISLSLLFLVPGFFCIKKVFNYGDPKELNKILAGTGLLLMIYTLFFTLGLLF